MIIESPSRSARRNIVYVRLQEQGKYDKIDETPENPTMANLIKVSGAAQPYPPGIDDENDSVFEMPSLEFPSVRSDEIHRYFLYFSPSDTAL